EDPVMSASEALRLARAAGIIIQVDGDELVLEAKLAPPPGVVAELALNKPSILALLRSGVGAWSADDWQAYFDERASILEHEAGLSRAESERHAFEECVIKWVDQNAIPSASGACGWCGRTKTRDAVVLPLGTEPSAHGWLHSECWRAWHRARRHEA